ncbi:LuxR C-terminal-related transcriptional regulator [Tomitella gaofuii]|uniref:LuxR C-terminal-related transcriptional regulator n=1 Tax=Tomitella gaofuii TaxID=2760083 RepID=UPI001C70BB7B|nr:LuxR C-terminal-related transcriptional regulator [Tomitella gaofuii]
MAHDDRVAIRDAVGRLHRESGLPMVFGGAITGRDRLQITEFVGAKSGTMRGLRVQAGSGLGGKAMAMRRPVLVNDYARADAITHDYDEAVTGEGIRTMVGVPVMVGRSVRGVLYGALRGTVAIGDRVIDSMVTVGRVLEQDLAVRDAMERRNPSSAIFPLPDENALEDAPPEIRRRLLDLAGRVDDPAVRDELMDVVAQLEGASGAGVVPGVDNGGMATAEPRRAPPRVQLSPREREVLVQVAMGHTNALIGERLGVGAETVKSYLRTAMRKLGANNRIEAVVAARRLGAL